MNNNIFQELIKKQRNNLIPSKKLSFSDLKRIASNLNNSIFTEECSLWNKNKNNSFIIFFFNKKKHVLHRLLFYNFIDDLSDIEYLKYSCPNKGQCCNINHINKVFSENSEIENVGNENNDKKESKNKKDITVEF